MALCKMYSYAFHFRNKDHHHIGFYLIHLASPKENFEYNQETLRSKENNHVKTFANLETNCKFHQKKIPIISEIYDVKCP